MKTVTVDDKSLLIIRARGDGDGGGIVLSYFVDEKDGTFSTVREWYQDPATADKVYEASDDAHMRWCIDEARRQTIIPADRPEQKLRPTPVALTKVPVGDTPVGK